MVLGNVAKDEAGKDLCKSKGNQKWMQQPNPNVAMWLKPHAVPFLTNLFFCKRYLHTVDQLSLTAYHI